ARGLVDCYLSSDLVEFHAHAPRLVQQAGERPAVSPVARRQARVGRAVTNRLHATVQLNDLERQLVAHLDGTRDRAALVEVLAGGAPPRPAARRGFPAAVNHEARTSRLNDRVIVPFGRMLAIRMNGMSGAPTAKPAAPGRVNRRRPRM